MKKKLLSVVVTTFLCFSSAFAVDLPSGYVSIYSLNSETELCPYTVPAAASYQFVGPAAGWGALTDHDLSNYTEMVFKLTYDAADGGNQVAIRFAVNGAAANPVLATLPTDATTYTVSIPLEQYKDAAGAIGLGGIVFYNGATHWAITYDGTASNTEITVDYIALLSTVSGVASIKADNPDSIVNVYSMTGSLVRKNVKQSEATSGLKQGLYIVNNKKVFVNK